MKSGATCEALGQYCVKDHGLKNGDRPQHCRWPHQHFQGPTERASSCHPRAPPSEALRALVGGTGAIVGSGTAASLTTWCAQRMLLLFCGIRPVSMARPSSGSSTFCSPRLDGRHYATHGHGRVCLPPLGKVLDFVRQVYVSDVAGLHHEVVCRREDLQRVDFPQHVAGRCSFRRSQDDLERRSR